MSVHRAQRQEGVFGRPLTRASATAAGGITHEPRSLQCRDTLFGRAR